jgi:methionyl-tRNA synthetase
MLGHEVHFVCADDAHGAPIMIAAEKAGQTPQQFVAGIAAGRKRTWTASTSLRQLAQHRRAREPRAGAGHLPRQLRKNGLIDVRTIEQFFDPVKGMFLPDRFIKGECPKCGAKDQYGDSTARPAAPSTPPPT